MGHYQFHVFLCTHERESGQACCGRQGQALERLAHAKTVLRQRQQADLIGKRCRINKSGCMDRCALGPVLVIYPEGVWYRYDTDQDIEEILDRHLGKGEIIQRLKLEP